MFFHADRSLSAVLHLSARRAVRLEPARVGRRRVAHEELRYRHPEIAREVWLDRQVPHRIQRHQRQLASFSRHDVTEIVLIY